MAQRAAELDGLVEHPMTLPAGAWPQQVDAVLTRELRPRQPPWFADAVEEIGRYLVLPSNWDGHRGRVVDPETVSAALDVMRPMFSATTPRPVLAPTPRGTLSWEWELDGLYVVVEFTSPTRAHIYVEDDGCERDETVQSDFSPLLEVLARVNANQGPRPVADPTDDTSISDDAVLWRRVPVPLVDFDATPPRPKSQAFDNSSPRPDGSADGMSVFLADEARDQLERQLRAEGLVAHPVHSPGGPAAGRRGRCWRRRWCRQGRR
jgi:hypothetical protein